jgi:ribonuclease PH
VEEMMANEDQIKSFDALREKLGMRPKGPRSDGRQLDELRPVSIELEFYRPHQVLVSYGNTKVVCAASIENRVPQWRYGSGMGWLTAEYSLLPASTDKRTVRERGVNASGRTYEIQRLIGRSLRTVVKLGLLGQCTIYVDCDVISADGGTRSASITGGFVALYSLIKANEKRFSAWPIKEPICAVSAGLVKDKPMLDLNYEEDSSAQVDGCAVFLKSGRIVDFSLSGEESSFTQDDLQSIYTLSKSGCETIFEIMNDQIVNIDSKYSSK